jgi:acyl-CoA thioesterase
MLAFDHATAVERVAPGRYGYVFGGEWTGLRGPHGGFLAAILLRAMEAEVGPGRSPRSFTVHFAAPPAPGHSLIEVREERRGGRLSTVSARLTQGGQAMAIALGALSAAREGPDITDAVMPQVPLPEDLAPTPARPHQPHFADHFDYRYALGGRVFHGGDRAYSGGWMRLRRPVPIDAAVVACLADAWMPSLFTRIDFRAYAPTVDLTVHFRAQLPLPDLGPDEFVLGMFSSKRAEGGFWEEDGELWTRGGRLIAQSRQLALVIPVPLPARRGG